MTSPVTLHGEMVVTSDGRELTPGVDYEFDRKTGTITLLPHVRKCRPKKRPRRTAQWKVKPWEMRP